MQVVGQGRVPRGSDGDDERVKQIKRLAVNHRGLQRPHTDGRKSCVGVGSGVGGVSVSGRLFKSLRGRRQANGWV